MIDSVDTVRSLDDLNQQLCQLRESGAALVDPVVWAYIVALHQRLPTLKGRRLELAQRRLVRAIDQFTATREELLEQVDDCLRALPLLSAPQSAHCAELREQGDLRGLLRYVRECRRRFEHSHLVDELAALRRALDASLEIEVVGLSEVDKKLRAQQREILTSLSDDSDLSSQTVDPVSAQSSAPSSLKSIKLLQQRSEQGSVAQRVEQAIQRSPESPGPLNPQMLAIKALTQMRDLSPQYLQRYIAYLDTLFWLDEVDTAANPPKGDKKKNAAKAKKKRA